MTVELRSPSFKPREYEGEKIEYRVYGLDDEGREIECIDGPVDTPDSAAVLAEDILEQFPNLYFHVTAVLNDENGKMKDSEVVWSNFPEDESRGANETIEYKKGHKNSRGEDAPWVILDHKNGKVLVSFSKKDDAEAHLERMKHYRKGERLFNKKELESVAMNGYKAAVTAAWSDAGIKNFKIDIRANEEEPPALDVYPKTLDGKDIDVSWRLLPNVMKIVQYSISPAGNHTIERELDFATEDDVEIIFTDEFKSVDDVLEHGIGSYDSANELSENDIIKEQAMGIKLIKKKTPATLSESSLNASTFAEPSFDAVEYGLEEISKNDSGEVEIVDGIDSDGSAQALADEVTALHKRHPEKKYHITAIGTDSDGIADKSEVIWSDYPEEVSANENAPAKNEGRVMSYFVLHKNTELKAIEKIVVTLEDAILNNQTVEATANPDGTVSIEIYGRMTPDEVARAIQLPGQLGTSYVDLAINIEG